MRLEDFDVPCDRTVPGGPAGPVVGQLGEVGEDALIAWRATATWRAARPPGGRWSRCGGRYRSSRDLLDRWGGGGLRPIEHQTRGPRLLQPGEITARTSWRHSSHHRAGLKRETYRRTGLRHSHRSAHSRRTACCRRRTSPAGASSGAAEPRDRPGVAWFGRVVAGKTQGVSAGAAIVVVLGSVAVIGAVAWFVLNRKHPENAASHEEAPRIDLASSEPVDGSRPAGSCRDRRSQNRPENSFQAGGAGSIPVTRSRNCLLDRIGGSPARVGPPVRATIVPLSGADCEWRARRFPRSLPESTAPWKAEFAEHLGRIVISVALGVRLGRFMLAVRAAPECVEPRLCQRAIYQCRLDRTAAGCPTSHRGFAAGQRACARASHSLRGDLRSG